MSESQSAGAEALRAFSEYCARWLRSTGAKEMVVEIDALGRRSTLASRVLRKAGILRRVQWVEGDVPERIIARALDLRRLMAVPGRGAWTTAFLSMSDRDYALVSEFSYDREPYLRPGPSAQDCAEERRLYPRDAASTPSWMLGMEGAGDDDGAAPRRCRTVRSRGGLVASAPSGSRVGARAALGVG